MPDTALETDYHYGVIARAIAEIDRAGGGVLPLDELAARMGMSPAHFQRLFSAWAGVSPKRFQQYLTLGHARRLLAERHTTLETAEALGLSGAGRLHDLFLAWEAMSPGEYAQSGAGLEIGFAWIGTPFGEALAMATPRGLCGLAFAGECGREAAWEDMAPPGQQARRENGRTVQRRPVPAESCPQRCRERQGLRLRERAGRQNHRSVADLQHLQIGLGLRLGRVQIGVAGRHPDLDHLGHIGSFLDAVQIICLEIEIRTAEFDGNVTTARDAPSIGKTGRVPATCICAPGRAPAYNPAPALLDLPDSTFERIKCGGEVAASHICLPVPVPDGSADGRHVIAPSARHPQALALQVCPRRQTPHRPHRGDPGAMPGPAAGDCIHRCRQGPGTQHIERLPADRSFLWYRAQKGAERGGLRPDPAERPFGQLRRPGSGKILKHFCQLPPGALRKQLRQTPGLGQQDLARDFVDARAQVIHGSGSLAHFPALRT